MAVSFHIVIQKRGEVSAASAYQELNGGQVPFIGSLLKKMLRSAQSFVLWALPAGSRYKNGRFAKKRR